MFRSHACQRVAISLQQLGWPHSALSSRFAYARAHGLQTKASPEPIVPFRKQFNDEAKQRRAVGKNAQKTKADVLLEKWELTVGIEIHAQLNTERKLFSSQFP